MPYCGDHGDGGAVPLSLRGSIEAFPLEIVLQLLAATRKRGVLDVRSHAGEHGAVGVMDGRPSSARYGDSEGPLAFGALLAIDGGERNSRTMREARPSRRSPHSGTTQ